MKGDTHTRELRALLRLGAPIALAQAFQIGMQLVDTAMAGRYAPTDLAGIALGGSLIMPLHVLMMGLLHAVTPIVAQLHGAGRDAEVGAVVRQAIWVGLGISVAMMLVAANAGRALPLFGVTPAAATVATGYLRAVLWGYPGLALFVVFRTTVEGLGNTRPPMIIAGLLLLLNVPLNYAFIYGNFGAPELGGVGVGVATAIIRWLQCALMLFVITRPAYARMRMFVRDWRPDPVEIRRIARIGIPIGLKIFAVVTLFALCTLLLAPFGELAVAAGHTGGMITTLVFMVANGLGMAATIRVGHAVGATDYAQARMTGRTAVRLAVVYAAVMALVLGVFRSAIASIFTQSPDLIAMIANLLLIVAVYQFMDCSQEAAVGALRGYKDTRVPMLCGLAGYWVVGFPVALGLGYGWFVPEPLSVYGFWTGFAAGEMFVAVTVNVRRIRLSRDPVRIAYLAADGAAA